MVGKVGLGTLKVPISSHKRAAGTTSTVTGTQTTKGHHYLGIATLLEAQRLHLTGPPVVPAEQSSKSRRGRVCATGKKKRRGGEGREGEGREGEGRGREGNHAAIEHLHREGRLYLSPMTQW